MVVDVGGGKEGLWMRYKIIFQHFRNHIIALSALFSLHQLSNHDHTSRERACSYAPGTETSRDGTGRHLLDEEALSKQKIMQ